MKSPFSETVEQLLAHTYIDPLRMDPLGNITAHSEVSLAGHNQFIADTEGRLVPSVSPSYYFHREEFSPDNQKVVAEKCRKAMLTSLENSRAVTAYVADYLRNGAGSFEDRVFKTLGETPETHNFVIKFSNAIHAQNSYFEQERDVERSHRWLEKKVFKLQDKLLSLQRKQHPFVQRNYDELREATFSTEEMLKTISKLNTEVAAINLQNPELIKEMQELNESKESLLRKFDKLKQTKETSAFDPIAFYNELNGLVTYRIKQNLTTLEQNIAMASQKYGFEPAPDAPEMRETFASLLEFIGTSPAMKSTLEVAENARLTILLPRGEEGTRIYNNRRSGAEAYANSLLGVICLPMHKKPGPLKAKDFENEGTAMVWTTSEELSHFAAGTIYTQPDKSDIVNILKDGYEQYNAPWKPKEWWKEGNTAKENFQETHFKLSTQADIGHIKNLEMLLYKKLSGKKLDVWESKKWEEWKNIVADFAVTYQQTPESLLQDFIETAHEILDVNRRKGYDRTEISKEGFAKLPAFDQGLRPKAEASIETKKLTPPKNERGDFYTNREHPVTLSPATNFLFPHRSQFHDLYVVQAKEWCKEHNIRKGEGITIASEDKSGEKLSEIPPEESTFVQKLEQQNVTKSDKPTKMPEKR